jgi:hypothetical protein
MTFEKRTLVLMAIEGPLDISKIPFLTSNRRVFPFGKDRFILLYGTEIRQENDAEQALNDSLQLKTLNLKIFITTEFVLYERQAPKIEWNQTWDSSLKLLVPNEIGVSLDMVRIYQRIFDMHAKRIKKESIFILDRKKIIPSRIRGLQKKYLPLVGRKKELHQLLEVIEQSFEDQGQIASIIGDAGLGKTRLKVELTAELERKKIKFYEGYFSLSSDLNFRGFHQLVQQILEQNTETFSRWDLNESESAFLRYFLHPEEKNDVVRDLNEKEQTQGIFNSILKLFTNIGREPTVFILDDFHWAGDTSIKFMELLAQSLEKTKIAFFLIHRPTFIPNFQKRLNYHQIKLAPLQHNETKEFVKNTLKLDYVTDGAIETLNNLSLGNPLYVEEVLRELISRKELDLQKSDDVLRLIQIEYPKGAIPTNIRSLITARLDLLSKEAKEILQWVCTFGFRENQDDFELFLQTLNLSLETFHDLFNQGYLEEASMFPEHKYKFNHDLLYETIKQTIPEKKWAENNQRIAEYLKQLYQREMIIHGDRIADFYIKGEMDKSSFEPIFEAAKIALDQKRYSRAVKYFDHANNLLLANKIKISDQDFFHPYIESLFSCGEKDKIITTLKNWTTFGFTSEQSEIDYYKLFLDYLFTYHESEDLLKISQIAILKFKDKINSKDLFSLNIRKFQGLVFKFNFNDAVHLAFKLLREATDKPNFIEEKIDILYSLGFITQQSGYPNVGSYLTLIAKNNADQISRLRQKSKVYQRIAYLAVAQGLYKEALHVWGNISHLYQENGYPGEKILITSNSILNLYFLGNYKEALNMSKRLDLGDADWNQRWALNWIGQIYLAMGSFQKTKEHIGKYRYFPMRDPYIRCNFLYLTANYHYQLGEFQKAKTFYRYAKKFYQKKEQKIYGFQMQLFELRCRLLLKETSVEEATKEFDFIIAHEEMRKYFYEWNTQMLSFWFARHGCDIRFKPSEDVDPMKCNAVYLRMMMFVEKIKWLESVGKKDKAEEVRKQYLDHRLLMVFYVPDEFKKSYLEHPFYQV